jgi:GNAT superfamily N-acetyltransferase
VLSVSLAEPADVPAIAALIEEMDRFYGETEFAPIDVRIAEIKANLFDASSGIHVLLARDTGQIAGLASYSFLWPAVGISRSIYLKELYVSSSHRRRGLGRKLMEALTAIAVDRGCSRLEWTTDRDNADARAFYAELGFDELSAKVFYRLQH